MQIHTMVFVHEHGPALGTYPLPEFPTHDDLAKVEARFKAANDNPSCIAAFWYVDGQMKQFQFNRA